MMKKLLLCLSAFIFAQANAQQIELVEDINLEGFASSQFDSNPSGFTEFNGKLYFSAKAPKTGQELFSYDGTDVELVADINPKVTVSGNAFYHDSSPNSLTVFDNKLYFIAKQANDTFYIYSYNGSSAPTVMINLETTSGSSLFEFNNKLHYITHDAVTAVYQIWEYDGTNSPSVIHSEPTPASGLFYGFRAFVELNNKLYFSKFGSGTSVSTLYVYDGVNAPIAAPHSSSFYSVDGKAIVYNNKIYLANYDPQGTTAKELWSYDGVNAPTLVSNINPIANQGSNPTEFTIHNNKLYFTADDGTSGRELWQYDGTTTSMVADLNSSGSSNPYSLTVYNNKLHFIADNGTSGIEIFEYDGTNSPSITTEFVLGSDYGPIYNLATFQNELFFSGYKGTVGQELYKYDGTNISLVANIYDGSNGSVPRYLTEYKNKIYFSAFASVDIGEELYSYDGSSVALVADIDTAHNGWNGAGSSSQPQHLFTFNDFLYFNVYVGGGSKVMKYDGINPPIVATEILENAFNFKVFNNKLYYRADDGVNGGELWEYDGTNAATMVADIATGSASSYPQDLSIFGNKLVFTANNGINGIEMWQYDGTNAPTMVADVFPGVGDSYPSNFKEYDGKLYFNAQKDTIVGSELMVYDGTNAPSLVADLYTGTTNAYGNSSYPTNLNVINNKLYFVAGDSISTKELWEYDGTNTPSKITNYNITGFNASAQFTSMTVIDGELYFWANEGNNFGVELYKYDGTGMPVMFNEVNDGVGNSRPSNPSNLLKYNGDIYLSANDGVLGYVYSGELYKIASCDIDTTVTENNATLTANETGATYQWVDCDNGNDPLVGETNQSFTATQSGNYACIINKAACQETTACFNIIITGINNKELSNQVEIYPNPTSDRLNIISQFEILNVNVYNVLGEQVQVENSNNFSIANLNQGVYYMQIVTEKGIVNKQIIKK